MTLCGSLRPDANIIREASSAILGASMSAAGIFSAILVFGISMVGAVPQLDWLLKDIDWFLTISTAAIVFGMHSLVLSDGVFAGIS